MRTATPSLLLFILTTSACGDGTGDTGSPEASGEVYAPFDAHCVATFSDETEVQDVFGDTLFVAAAGSRYLMRSYDSPDRAELLYLSEHGPVDFEAAASAFTSNCSPGATQLHVGVFPEVTVFADLAATEALCTIPENTLWPSTGGGFALESDLAAEPAIYSVSYGGLEDHCAGATSGFVAVAGAQILGSNRHVVPLALFVGPA